MSNLERETQKLKKLTETLNAVNDRSLQKEDIARILEFVMALIPILTRILRSK